MAKLDLSRRAFLAGTLLPLVPADWRPNDLEQIAASPTIYQAAKKPDTEFRQFRDKVKSLETKILSQITPEEITPEDLEASTSSYDNDIGIRIGQELNREYISIMNRLGFELELERESIFTVGDNVVVRFIHIGGISTIVLDDLTYIAYLWPELRYAGTLVPRGFKTYTLISGQGKFRLENKDPPLEEISPFVDYSNFSGMCDRIRILNSERKRLFERNYGIIFQGYKWHYLDDEPIVMARSFLQVYGIENDFIPKGTLDAPSGFIKIYLRSLKDWPDGEAVLVIRYDRNVNRPKAALTFQDSNSPIGYSVKPVVPAKQK